MTLRTETELSPLVAARVSLAAALETATGFTAHATFTTALHTPCYVVQPDGWQWFAAADAAMYRVTVTCLYADQSGDTADPVEELARQAALVCQDQGWKIPDVPAPGTVQNPADTNRPLAGVQFTATQPVTIRE